MGNSGAVDRSVWAVSQRVTVLSWWPRIGHDLVMQVRLFRDASPNVRWHAFGVVMARTMGVVMLVSQRYGALATRTLPRSATLTECDA
jgi:hypothetical protein